MSARRSRLAAALAIFLAVGPAPARAQTAAGADAFVVEEIRVEGLDRLDPGVVFRELEPYVGLSFDAAAAARAIHALYRGGYFRDVRLLRDGAVLVARVKENPTVAAISFSGLDEFEDELLLGELAKINIAPRRLLNPADLESAAALIEAAYLERAFYRVDVETTSSPLPRNRVNINFAVVENEQTAIESIEIEGAQQIDAGDLRERMDLAPRGLLSFFRDDHLYSRRRLAGDLEAIRSYYLERGFLQATIDPPQVELSPDLSRIDIHLRIDEGEPFTVSGHRFEGEIPLSPDEIEAAKRQQAGEIYDAVRAEETARVLRAALGDLGFANALVEFDARADDAQKTVELVYAVDPRAPVYVRRIEIVGNYYTRDEVLRREMLQFEREKYARGKIEESLRRLRRTNLFQSVTGRLRPVAGEPDLVDWVVEVEEGSVGYVSGGFTYSQVSRLGFDIEYKNRNILGSGNELDLKLAFNDDERAIGIDINQPFYTAEGISRHVGVNAVERESSGDTEDYSLSSYSFAYGYGFPVAPNRRLFVDLVLQQVEIDRPQNLNALYRRFTDKHGDSLQGAILRFSLLTDTRDTGDFPTEGQRIRIGGEAALPALDFRYYRLTYDHDWYRPLRRDKGAILHWRGSVGVGGGYEDDDADYPFYRRFYAGGVNSVRGFRGNTISPRHPIEDETIGNYGGLFSWNNSLAAEIDWTPFRGQRTRWSAFVDAGAVSATASETKLSETRASVGAQVAWLTPFGPLKIAYAVPLRTVEGDTEQKLQFSFGF